ncbi:beta-galactosidase [Paenibacillus marinisediminis]
MIDIRNKQIIMNGEPQLIMCGEIHYFRLERKDWQDRIAKLKAAGCNAVASYIPWICHEPLEGQVDLTGATRPELDLGTFIDMCKDNDLYFIARPGPFIMAEMKNEGLPYWVYEKHPDIIPVGWDGKPAPTRTIDYMAPGFLQEARNWYAEVMAVLAPRLYTKGGNTIAVQLDNEIGMLAWCSNSPDLTDHLLADFAGWLHKQYDAETLKGRYPFDLNDAQARKTALRSPEEGYAAELLHDLGHFMRNRFARYVAELRAYAEESGVTDIPFLVNIHGTGGGRGFGFPIGISQLYESYTQAPGYMSGSDIYFGNLTMNNFQDLYLINGFMDAVHLPDQPLTSLEFECGDGNYGSTYGGRYDTSAADFKTRMCIAQGNRMLNYYLFSGGINYRLTPKTYDGNDRIAFTGERHGFAAPINPEGEINYTYPRMARVIQTMMAVSNKIAAMDEERDDVAFAFIPDYFMTEYRYPGSAKMNDIIQNIESNRSYGGWEIMARAMLLGGYRFGSVDIQNKTLDPRTTPVLAIASARYLHAQVQQKLVDYMREGGGVLLYGEVPLFDMEGMPCTILADALSVVPAGTVTSGPEHYLSVCAEGWAAPRPEIRANFAQLFKTGDTESIISVYGSGEVCGFEAKVGKGRAIVIATSYDCDIPLFKEALERLGAKAALSHDFAQHGIFMTSTANQQGERFLHMINLDSFDKELMVEEHGSALFDGRKLLLQSNDGVMLPMNVTFGDVKIVYSTAEITSVTAEAIGFRLTQAQDVISIETKRSLVPSDDYTVERNGDSLLITSCKHAKVDDHFTIQFY